MKNQPTKISVIIPTVNASQELDLALLSLLHNSTLPLELLVIVDPDQKTGKIDSSILEVCKKHHIKPYRNDHNLGPYGSWNRGAQLATTDYFVFATDDQYFAPGWETELLRAHKPRRLVAGRLVEPGIIPVYPTNIEHNFGTTPAEFKEDEFLNWCQSQINSGFVADGFFIPLLISRSDFADLGDYPTRGKFGTASAASNDYEYIKTAKTKGYEFGTASGSFSYHFQASSWKKKTSNPRIGAVVLTKNNASTLGDALKSLTPLVTKIYLVDCGSTDRTKQIAAKYHVDFHTHEFTNFAAQRNFGLTLVQDYDWVLMLDADEVVEESLVQELKSAAQDIYLDGITIKRKNYIWGKWIEHTDWYPDERLVFFRPKIVNFINGVHERANFIRPNARLVSSHGHILHYNYDTVAEFITKNLLTYPAAYAKELRSRGVSFNVYTMFESSLAEFMRRYFLSRGYIDGMHGLLLSSLMGIQQFVTYIYLWEIEGKSTNFSHLEFRNVLGRLKKKLPELLYWLQTLTIENSRGVRKFIAKLSRKTNTLLNHL